MKTHEKDTRTAPSPEKQEPTIPGIEKQGVVHMDVNEGEVLFCDECGEEISNDAWLLIDEKNVDSTMCDSCYRDLKVIEK